MKNVELKVLSVFQNANVKFIFAKVVNKETEFEYVMVAEQGLQRIVLGGTKDAVKRFLFDAVAFMEQ